LDLATFTFVNGVKPSPLNMMHSRAFYVPTHAYLSILLGAAVLTFDESLQAEKDEVVLFNIKKNVELRLKCL
jgi:hypothetical protein